MESEKEFAKILQELTLAWQHVDLEGALLLHERIIREGSPAMQAQSLYFLGLIREKSGDEGGAMEYWVQGLQLAERGSFLKYTLEESLGSLHGRLGSPTQSLAWYRSALKTCVEGAEFSGNRALSAFLAINHGSIPPEDDDLVAAVLTKSWLILAVPNSPDLEDLPGSIESLNKFFSTMLEEL